MRTFFITSIAVALCAQFAHAQRFQQEAYLVFDVKTVQQVWISNSQDGKITYFENERGVDSTARQMPVLKPQAIWLLEPAEYADAIELFQGRKYEEAKTAFQKIRKTYMPLTEIPDNYATLAGFYELECLRKLNQLEPLAAALGKFPLKERLLLNRPHQKRQVEIHEIWANASKGEWSPVIEACTKLLSEDIPGYQRAQVSYLYGLALDATDKDHEAIYAFNTAMTADTGASEFVTADSALKIMDIYMNNEDVKVAMADFGTDAAKPTAKGAVWLTEAASVAKMYELTLGNRKPLPEAYKGLLKYLPKEEGAASSKPEGGEEKPEGGDKEE